MIGAHLFSKHEQHRFAVSRHETERIAAAEGTMVRMETTIQWEMVRMETTMDGGVTHTCLAHYFHIS
jgi:hypothetical protein